MILMTLQALTPITPAGGSTSKAGRRPSSPTSESTQIPRPSLHGSPPQPARNSAQPQCPVPSNRQRIVSDRRRARLTDRAACWRIASVTHCERRPRAMTWRWRTRDFLVSRARPSTCATRRTSSTTTSHFPQRPTVREALSAASPRRCWTRGTVTPPTRWPIFTTPMSCPRTSPRLTALWTPTSTFSIDLSRSRAELSAVRCCSVCAAL